jgi:hypothetical protein
LANNFSEDARCVALWRFENGALTTDSIGTNTLSAVATPVADLADYKEGAACVDIEYADGDYFTITDTNLDAGFPLKNGDTSKKLTWCAWIKQESQTATAAYILSKYDLVGNKRSIALVTTSNVLYVNWGYSGGASYETLNTGIAIANGEWYHVALVVDGVLKTVSVRVYKASTGVVYTYTVAPTNELNVEDAAFRVAARDGDTSYRYDGRIDEVVIFDDQLTATEIDKIRKGTFPFGYEGSAPLTLVPQGLTYGPHAYDGLAPITLTPQAICGGPHTPYVGYVLFRLTPIASYSEVGAGGSVAIATSTGGWALGGAGVWVFFTPAHDYIPEIDPATGLPTVSLTGFVLGGGAEINEPEAISTFPGTDEIVPEGGFKFCGPEITGSAATTFPVIEAIVPADGFVLGGAGVWGQVAPGDIPSTVLADLGGGFVLGGTGQLPAVTPTTTEIVSTGGFVFGGFRLPPVSITYPTSYDKTIIATAAFEMGGEGYPTETLPTTTIIVSDGAIFVVAGGGLATTKLPPVAVITGDALGGFVLAGAEPTEVFESWVLNGQAFEPSIFSGFNFNSFAQHQGNTYAAGEDGIYLLGGDHDAGDTIHTGARIGPVNFGEDCEKRLRGVQFGKAGKNTRVRVESTTGEGVFAPDRDENRVVVSRNIQGNEFIIDVVDFQELSLLEVTTLKLARR